MKKAAGKVCVGYSDPHVAKYSCADDKVTFTDGRRLARGVDVKISPETVDSNDFYADSEIAESESGHISGGTMSLTVDGLHQDAERFVYGLPEPENVEYGAGKSANITKYPSNMDIPYVGVGVVIHYLSAGVTTFVPAIVLKNKFKVPSTEAATREKETNYQTQSLETTFMPDDTSKSNWKWVGEDCATRADAVAVLKGLMNVADAAAQEA